MCWELGANMGHIDRMLVSARELRTRGHTVAFALRDLSRAHARVALEGFPMLQSPIWLPPLTKPPHQGNYSAVLAAAGWMNAPGLAALLVAWQELYALWQPDIVIADHAPTSILAARGTGLRHWCIGNSFEVPPRGAVFPPLFPEQPGSAAACAGWDDQLLGPVNDALKRTGQPRLVRLTDLFAKAGRAVLSLPELTHYRHPSDDVAFPGPVFVDDIGAAPQWPDATGPRAFIYLAPTDAEFGNVLTALRDQQIVALVHAKGIGVEAMRKFGAPTTRFEPEPVRMDDALRDAQLVVSHASLGTVSAAALAGKVQLVLPRHAEQAMVARRVAEAGIGLVAPSGGSAQSVQARLKRLLTEPAFATQAAALAARHQDVRPAQTGRNVADLLLA